MAEIYVLGSGTPTPFFTHHHFDHNIDYPCFLPCRSVVDLARDADMMLCMCWDDQEVMNQSGEASGQCGTTGAAEMAQEAGVKNWRWCIWARTSQPRRPMSMPFRRCSAFTKERSPSPKSCSK